MSQNKTHNIKTKFLETFEKKACNISETCKSLNIGRKQYYTWMKDDEKFKESVNHIEEGLLDFAETQLIKNIKSGKETSLIFFLKCRGKRRGYIERQELEHSGSLETTINIIPASKKGD